MTDHDAVDLLKEQHEHIKRLFADAATTDLQ